jgi:hypothetical protein
MKKWMTLMLGMALLSGGVAVTLRLRRQPRRDAFPQDQKQEEGKMFRKGKEKPPTGIAPEFAAFLAAPTIPAVDPEDMRRVWPLFEGLEGGTGIDIKLLAQRCSANANVLAVSTRVQLARSLLQQGLLDKWREGDSLRPQVFEVIAKCALAPGGQGLRFDTQAILAAIKSAG